MTPNKNDLIEPEITAYAFEGKGIAKIDVDENNRAEITMTLTAPGCPMADMIVQDVYDKVMSVEGVDDVFVDLTFEPAWDKSMMSEEAKLELGFF